MSESDYEAAYQEFLKRWGYSSEALAETELHEAYKRIQELQVEVRVLYRVIETILRERF